MAVPPDQLVQGLAYFSTDGGKRPPRPAGLRLPPVIARSDFHKDVGLFTNDLRARFPHFCYSILSSDPAADAVTEGGAEPEVNFDIRHYFDEYDFLLHGGRFLFKVLEFMQRENDRLAATIDSDWARSQSSDPGQWMMAMHVFVTNPSPAPEKLFAPDDFERWGSVMLERVTKRLTKTYRDTCKQQEAEIAEYLNENPLKGTFTAYPLQTNSPAADLSVFQEHESNAANMPSGYLQEGTVSDASEQHQHDSDHEESSQGGNEFNTSTQLRRTQSGPPKVEYSDSLDNGTHEDQRDYELSSQTGTDSGPPSPLRRTRSAPHQMVLWSLPSVQSLVLESQELLPVVLDITEPLPAVPTSEEPLPAYPDSQEPLPAVETESGVPPATHMGHPMSMSMSQGLPAEFFPAHGNYATNPFQGANPTSGMQVGYPVPNMFPGPQFAYTAGYQIGFPSGQPMGYPMGHPTGYLAGYPMGPPVGYPNSYSTAFPNAHPAGYLASNLPNYPTPYPVEYHSAQLHSARMAVEIGNCYERPRTFSNRGWRFSGAGRGRGHGRDSGGHERARTDNSMFYESNSSSDPRYYSRNDNTSNHYQYNFNQFQRPQEFVVSPALAGQYIASAPATQQLRHSGPMAMNVYDNEPVNGSFMTENQRQMKTGISNLNGTCEQALSNASRPRQNSIANKRVRSGTKFSNRAVDDRNQSVGHNHMGSLVNSSDAAQSHSKALEKARRVETAANPSKERPLGTPNKNRSKSEGEGSSMYSPQDARSSPQIQQQRPIASKETGPIIDTKSAAKNKNIDHVNQPTVKVVETVKPEGKNIDSLSALTSEKIPDTGSNPNETINIQDLERTDMSKGMTSATVTSNIPQAVELQIDTLNKKGCIVHDMTIADHVVGHLQIAGGGSAVLNVKQPLEEVPAVSGGMSFIETTSNQFTPSDKMVEKDKKRQSEIKAACEISVAEESLSLGKKASAEPRTSNENRSGTLKLTPTTKNHFDSMLEQPDLGPGQSRSIITERDNPGMSLSAASATADQLQYFSSLNDPQADIVKDRNLLQSTGLEGQTGKHSGEEWQISLGASKIELMGSTLSSESAGVTEVMEKHDNRVPSIEENKLKTIESPQKPASWKTQVRPKLKQKSRKSNKKKGQQSASPVGVSGVEPLALAASPGPSTVDMAPVNVAEVKSSTPAKTVLESSVEKRSVLAEIVQSGSTIHGSGQAVMKGEGETSAISTVDSPVEAAQASDLAHQQREAEYIAPKHALGNASDPLPGPALPTLPILTSWHKEYETLCKIVENVRGDVQERLRGESKELRGRFESTETAFRDATSKLSGTTTARKTAMKKIKKACSTHKELLDELSILAGRARSILAEKPKLRYPALHAAAAQEAPEQHDFIPAQRSTLNFMVARNNYYKQKASTYNRMIEPQSPAVSLRGGAGDFDDENIGRWYGDQCGEDQYSIPGAAEHLIQSHANTLDHQGTVISCFANSGGETPMPQLIQAAVIMALAASGVNQDTAQFADIFNIEYRFVQNTPNRAELTSGKAIASNGNVGTERSITSTRPRSSQSDGTMSESTVDNEGIASEVVGIQFSRSSNDKAEEIGEIPGNGMIAKTEAAVSYAKVVAQSGKLAKHDAFHETREPHLPVGSSSLSRMLAMKNGHKDHEDDWKVGPEGEWGKDGLRRTGA